MLYRRTWFDATAEQTRSSYLRRNTHIFIDAFDYVEEVVKFDKIVELVRCPVIHVDV